MRVPIYALLILLTGCASGEASDRRGEGLLVGTVVSVDRSPMAYDGDAVLLVDVDGESVEIRVPARINLCPARERIALGEVQVGDRVEVRGTRDSDGAIRPCEEPNHLLRRVR